MLQIAHYFPATNFTVTSTPDAYVATYITPSYGDGPPTAVDGVSVLVEAGVADAVVEVWCLKAEGDPTDNSHYFFGKTVLTSGASGVGGMATVDVNWPGVQIRVKSGGTAGTLTLSGVAFQREPRK